MVMNIVWLQQICRGHCSFNLQTWSYHCNSDFL